MAHALLTIVTEESPVLERIRIRGYWQIRFEPGRIRAGVKIFVWTGPKLELLPHERNRAEVHQYLSTSAHYLWQTGNRKFLYL